ncbi:hypothetical protein [Thalassobacillus sp. CUG 92003]|uniref:hypothetical protein n=1 Tax=Thalassobacillus sp. CUG 92003 TaxID=2736641 RepID=UPI0015E6C91C|nr:hypothetical protein [Thalassobacillus sp. CUG 92003]
MCNLCHGKGTVHLANQGSIGFMPCPNKKCREDAASKTDRVIDRMKKHLNKGASA